VDNATITSLEKFTSLEPRYTTHMSRFSSLLLRHAKSTALIVDALGTYPAGSMELNVVMRKMLGEIQAMSDEAIETIDDIQSDLTGLADIFQAFHEEIKKMKNDTP
jgi:hypothetical protein